MEAKSKDTGYSYDRMKKNSKSCCVVLALQLLHYSWYFLPSSDWHFEDRMQILNAIFLYFGMHVSIFSGHSLFDIMEIALVLMIDAQMKTTSLSFFYSTKLVISFVTFLLTLRDGNIKDTHILYYFFPIGRLHRVYPEEFEIPVGRTHNRNQDVVNSKLLASRKCHNWTLKELYHLSTTKFLIKMTLRFFRWEGWLLCLIYVTVLFVAGDCDNSSRVVSSALNLVLSLIFCLDSFKMERKRSESNAGPSFHRYLVELFWFVCVITVYCFTFYLIPSETFFIGQSFVCYMAITFIISLVMWYILPSFVLSENAKQRYDHIILEKRKEQAKYALDRLDPETRDEVIAAVIQGIKE